MFLDERIQNEYWYTRNYNDTIFHALQVEKLSHPGIAGFRRKLRGQKKIAQH